MPPLSRDEFLAVGGMTPTAFDQLGYAGNVALAFGSPVPATPGRYLPADLVAMVLAAQLTRALGRRNATDFVLGFFDTWIDAVARAEVEPETPFFFAVAAIGPRNDPDEYLITSGAAAEIEKDLAEIRGRYTLVRVGINGILQTIRDAAKRVSVDLSAPFFLPSTHADYSYFIITAREEREGRLKRLRADKKRLAAQKRRERRKDIHVAERLTARGAP